MMRRLCIAIWRTAVRSVKADEIAWEPSWRENILLIWRGPGRGLHSANSRPGRTFLAFFLYDLAILQAQDRKCLRPPSLAWSPKSARCRRRRPSPSREQCCTTKRARYDCLLAHAPSCPMLNQFALKELLRSKKFLTHDEHNGTLSTLASADEHILTLATASATPRRLCRDPKLQTAFGAKTVYPRAHHQEPGDGTRRVAPKAGRGERAGGGGSVGGGRKW